MIRAARLSAVIGLALALSACSSTPSAATIGPSMSAPGGSIAAVEPSPSASGATGYDGALGDIVFERNTTGSDQVSLFTIDADGTNEQLIHGSWDGIGLSPDGHTFLAPTVGPDGRLLPLLVAADGSGEQFIQVADQTLQLGIGDWSPDGARIVFDAWDDTDASRKGLYTMSRDGRDLVRLTKAGPRHDFPAYAGAYSADGARILFFRPATAVDADRVSMDLFVVNADGTNTVKLNPAGTETILFGPSGASDWSPDGKQVAFVGSDGDFWKSDRHALFTVGADGSHPKRITPWGDVLSVQWSPDGKTLAFSMASPTGYQIFTVHPDGTDLVQITSSNDGTQSFGPMWSPDGARLLFIRGAASTGASSTGVAERIAELRSAKDLWVVNADGTNPVQVTHSPSEYGGYAWTPR
jgi:Tol biopolymer transport system component